MKEKITIGINTATAIERMNQERKANGLNEIPASLFIDYTADKAICNTFLEHNRDSDYYDYYDYRIYVGEEYAGMHVCVIIPQNSVLSLVQTGCTYELTRVIKNDGTFDIFLRDSEIDGWFYYRFMLPFEYLRLDTKADAIKAFREYEERTNNREAEEIIETASLTL